MSRLNLIIYWSNNVFRNSLEHNTTLYLCVYYFILNPPPPLYTLLPFSASIVSCELLHYNNIYLNVIVLQIQQQYHIIITKGWYSMYLRQQQQQSPSSNHPWNYVGIVFCSQTYHLQYLRFFFLSKQVRAEFKIFQY